MNPFATTRRAALAGAMGALWLAGGAAAADVSLTAPVETTTGRVRGKRSEGISRFLGIPYGGDASQVRFQPAHPPAPWTGVRDCLAVGHQALQLEPAPPRPGVNMNTDFLRQVYSAMREGNQEGDESEDCLVLNVFTPEASRRRKRPVMFWMHGGGFTQGSAGGPQYDGGALARRGDVVVVTVNHRLNAMGYLYLGELHPDFADSGNVGELDLILALRWVRDNIEAFGGDPGNVTIFGESGGGGKVSTTLATPPAKGLFHKAIVISGPGLRMVEKADAVAHAERTLAELGVAPADVRRLQTMDPRAILRAAKLAQRPGPVMGGLALGPVVDGRTLPRHPFDPDAPAMSRDVPLIVGTTHDEATIFMAWDPLFPNGTETQVRERFNLMLHDRGPAAFELYRSLAPNDPPAYWMIAMVTGRGTWMDSIRLTERKAAQHGAPAYMFRFDWRTPFAGGAMRAVHMTDVPILFDNVATRRGMLGDGPEPQRLANVMSRALTDFARSGDPSQPGLAWPAYDSASRQTMVFDNQSRAVADPDRVAREFWSV